jgi:CRISPR/Cas system-associated exonuclease Cas4 (RecB family)
MAFSVVAALDKHILRLEEERKPDGFFHPSGIFGCPRKAVYEMRGTEKSNPPDERARRIFRVGHVLHELIQDAIALDDEVVAFYAEVKVFDPERGIKGAADGLVRLANGRWIVLEFKSINSMAFRFNDLPKEDHRGQASVYMDVLRTHGGTAELSDGTPVILPPFGEELTRATFAYVSKDDLKVEEFTMLWTDAKAEVIDERIHVLSTHLDAGTLPRRLPPTVKTNKTTKKTTSSRNYACGYCPFQTKCWNEDEEGVLP